MGCTACGMELSETRREYARERGISLVEWNDFPNNRFNFINTEQVFEHLVEPLDTLMKLKVALCVKGIIRIGVPSSGGIRRRLELMDWRAEKGSLNPVAPLERVNCFCRRSILAMSRCAGLIPASTHRPAPGDWILECTAREMLRPAHFRTRRLRFGEDGGRPCTLLQRA